MSLTLSNSPAVFRPKRSEQDVGVSVEQEEPDVGETG